MGRHFGAGWVLRLLEGHAGSRLAFGYLARQRWRLIYLLGVIAVCILVGVIFGALA